jgi:hypothetical protein
MAEGMQARALRDACFARGRCPDLRPGGPVDRTAVDGCEGQPGDAAMVLAPVWIGAVPDLDFYGWVQLDVPARAAIVTAGASTVRVEVFVLGGPR